MTFNIKHAESLSRGELLLRSFFGIIYIYLPHGFVLFFLTIGVLLAQFIGWWIILFTGKLPEGIHNFIVGYLRWATRVSLYMSNMTDTYPPFSLD